MYNTLTYLEGWSSEYREISKQKIYAWIKQIPISKIIYPSWISNSVANEVVEEKIVDDAAIPISPRRIWPALMLAASRKDKVINRTEILKVSVITRNGFSHSGAPLGSRWAIEDVGA